MPWLSEADPRSQSVRLRMADALARVGVTHHLEDDQPAGRRRYEPQRDQRRDGGGQRDRREQQPRRTRFSPRA
jgi:hypothetical protein